MPYRAPGLGDDRIDWLLTEVNTAQRTLDEQIFAAQQLPDSDLSRSERIIRLNQMQAEIDRVYGDLDTQTKTWAETDFKSFYRQGHATASSQLGVGFSFSQIHQEAVDVLAKDVYTDVASRLLQTRQGFTANTELQKAFESLDPSVVAAIQGQSRSSVAQMLLTGEDPRVVSKRLAQDLWSQGVQITDSAGRSWNTETYTRMLIRTKSANAYNAGSMNRYVDQGVSRVRVFDGVQDDEECAEANGQVWSLRYAMNHVIAHPNCRRAFAPEPGDGPVQKDTFAKYLVKFDRISLGLVGLGALRSFRSTGELNVSSTLARLVLETAEAVTGIHIPVMDAFVQGLVSGSFKELDGWIESYIDPFLYSVGVIRNVPTRAALQAALRPETFIDEIADSIKRANKEAFGVEYNPHVRSVLDDVDGVVEAIRDGFVPPTTPGDRGGIKYVNWAVDNLFGVSRYGQITAEAIRIVKTGEIDDLKDVWRQATDSVVQARQVREIYIRTALATREEAEELFLRLDDLLTEMVSVLDTQTDISQLPAVIEFMESYSKVNPIDIRRVVEYWSQGSGLEKYTDYEVRKMREMFSAVYQARGRALSRIEELDSIIEDRSRRQLLMAAPSGPDFPTEVHTLWDWQQFEDTFHSVKTQLLDSSSVNKSGGVNEDLLYSLQQFLTILKKDEDYFLKTDPSIISGFRSHIRPDLSAIDERFVVLDDIPTVDDQIDFWIDVVRDLSIDYGFLYWAGDVVDADDAVQLGRILDWFDTSYFDLEFRWRPVIDRAWSPDLLDRHLGNAVAEKGKQLNAQVQRLFDGVRDLDIAPPEDIYEDFYDYAVRVFGNTNVEVLGESGVNGAIVRVFDSETRSTVLIKRIQSTGHSGGREPTLASMAGTNFFAEAMGEIEAVPYRLFSLTDERETVMIVMPDIEDAVPWGEATDDLFRDDVLRRFALFDAVTLERDAHSYNYLVNEYTHSSTIIDREVSFGMFFGQKPFLNDPSNGLYSAAKGKWLNETVAAWLEGDDIRVLNDPPVSLFKLSKAERDRILRDDFDLDLLTSQLNHGPGLADTGVIVDPDGVSYIPAGRIGRGLFDPMWGSRGTEWGLASFPTQSEYRFLERIMEDSENLIDELAVHLQESFEELSDATKRGIIVWAGGGTIEQATKIIAGRMISNSRQRVAGMMFEGMINVSGGLTKHYSRDGAELSYGAVVKFTNKTTGEEIEGLVVNLFETNFTTGEVHAIVRPNIGLGKTASELENLSIDPRTLNLDDWIFGSPISELPRGRVIGYRNALSDASVLETEGQLASRARKRPVFDQFGMKTGDAEEQIEIVYQRSLGDSVTVVAEDGTEKRVVFYDLVNNSVIQGMISRELSRYPAEFRPKSIHLSMDKLLTDDGKSAFGVFNPDTGELHISLLPMFDVDALKPRLGFSSSYYYAADAGDWEFLQADLRYWVETLNTNRVQEVLRHELGHAAEVNLERTNLNKWSVDIYDQFIRSLDEDLDEAAINKMAADLIPEGFNTSAYETPVAALIAYRAGVIEDVINTNQAVIAKIILENGLNSGELPSWARAVYAGVLRSEPTAHNEFYAEIISRVKSSTQPTIGRQLSEVADDLNVSIGMLQTFLERGSTIDGIPGDWNIGSAQFVGWLKTNLHSRADRIIPLDRNQNRRLWSANRYSVPDIRTKVLGTPTEEGTGGITINLVTGDEPKTGYSVARRENERPVKGVTDDNFDEIVEQYIKDYAKDLAKPEWELGIWVDDAGTVYLDTVKVFNDEIEAASYGFREGQRSMYRFDGDGEVIDLLDKYESIDDYLRDRFPDLEYEEILAKGRKIGGVTTQRGSGAKKVIEEVFEVGGSFKVMSMEWMSPSARADLIDALKNRYSIPMTVTKGKANLEEVLERGMELYRLEPEFQDEFADFYFLWRNTFIDAASETIGASVQISAHQIAAAAAGMSASMEASVNLVMVLNMASVLSRDMTMTRRAVDETRAAIERSLAGARSRLAKASLDKKAKEQAYVDYLEELRNSFKVNQKINKMDPERRARAIAGMVIAEGRAPLMVPQQWAFLHKSIAILLGEMPPHIALTDTKFRPFYNNIIDPADVNKTGEVTIDFVMADAFFHAKGFGDINHVSPVITGISAGLRPIISDTVRELYEEGWGERLGLTSMSQLQSHIWNIWREGRKRGWWTNLPTVTLK